MSQYVKTVYCCTTNYAIIQHPVPVHSQGELFDENCRTPVQYARTVPGMIQYHIYIIQYPVLYSIATVQIMYHTQHTYIYIYMTVQYDIELWCSVS